MRSRLDFVSAAILDIQATIRAIDVKVAALLVGVLAPLANVSRVFSHLDRFGSLSPEWFFVLLAFLFLLSWLLALITLVNAIGAIDNPAQHIINTDGCRGCFYAGGLYSLNIVDAFLNRDIIKASKDPYSFSATLPANENEMEVELVFEQMKLAYIRDVKRNRLNWGLHFSVIWLVLGITIFLSSRYLVG